MNDDISDVKATIATLNTEVAVLKTRIDRMANDQSEMVVLMKEHNEEMKKQNADIHAIRETIATGKGAWWAAAGLVGAVLTGGGLLGAWVHSALKATPWSPP